MATTSFFDEIEKLFERVLTVFEHAVNHPILILERYSVRMYRFLRHMTLKMLRLLWLLTTLVFYILAPLYVGSFGDELRRKGINAAVQIIGIMLMLVGMAGVALLAFGLVVYLAPLFSAVAPPLASGTATDKPRRGLAVLASFDVAAILFVCLMHFVLSPAYVFTSPLLLITQNLLKGSF
jgi:hypothetical protein